MQISTGEVETRSPENGEQSREGGAVGGRGKHFKPAEAFLDHWVGGGGAAHLNTISPTLQNILFDLTTLAK